MDLCVVESARAVFERLGPPGGVTVGPDGMVFTGGEAGQTYHFLARGGQYSQTATTHGIVFGVAPDAGGDVYEYP